MSVCLLSLSELGTNKIKCALVSCLSPGPRCHMTSFCVAKTIPCVRVQPNAPIWPVTLVRVFVAMVTASGATVSETSTLDARI